jgi:DNA-binding CsgD family transcriptional regulator/PAS domain-containing protein
MSEAEKISQLIENIYDAALDPSLWQGVLAEAARFVDGVAATDQESLSRLDKKIIRLIEQIYRGEPLMFDSLPLGRSGASENSSRVDFSGTRALPKGSEDCLASELDELNKNFDHLRRQPRDTIDDGMRRRALLLLPHIRRASMIIKRIESEASRAASLAKAFDGLSAGICLVRANGDVVHANAAFQDILVSVDVVSVVNDRLVVADADIDRGVRDLIASTGQNHTGTFRGHAWPLKSSQGDGFILHVLPLPAGDKAAVTKASAIVVVCKAQMAPLSSPEIIGVYYRLTPTELRVLMAIVDVGGVPEVAEALGIAHTTVKTHLSRLFAKTGTSRQAELLKLVAGFATPFLQG